MESLNLNTLVSSLPTSAQQNAEKELLNNFKGASSFTGVGLSQNLTSIRVLAAALSITTLYRSSRKTSKRAYNAGYASACQDMLNFIQQGVSASNLGPEDAGPSHDVEGRGMTIGRVMDWTEARLDAIKALEEDEDEDEEREKDKDRTRSNIPPSSKPEPRRSTVAAPRATTSTSKVFLHHTFYLSVSYLFNCQRPQHYLRQVHL